MLQQGEGIAPDAAVLDSVDTAGGHAIVDSVAVGEQDAAQV